MPPALAETLAQLTAYWRAVPRRIQVLAMAAGVAAAVIGGGSYALSNLWVDYQVLFSNMTAEDANSVAEALRAGRVPYKITDDGKVLVPSSRVHEWRLKLASQGLPNGGGVGFEIFDKNQFGLTDFSQRLNFQRALQGELARTIGQIREVQQARVHLALPAPRVFSTQDKPASASVILRLRPGATLRQDQVRGIVHLVTAAVEGLTPDRVTVVDSAGRVLASGLERIGGLSANQQEARAAVETEIERRVQGILDPIVGGGRSAVRVAAVVNFDQIERTQERFDPKPLVRTQNKSTEQSQGTSSQPTSVGGASTPEANKPAESSANNKTQRESEQTTYEIARTVERTVVAPGNVNQLSVAVLLDIPAVNGARTPRSPEDLDRIKKLVASAAGIKADRNDEIEVMQVPFDPSVAVPGEPAAGAHPAVPQVSFHRRIVVFGVPMWVFEAAGAMVLSLGAFFLFRLRRRRSALLSAVTAAIEAEDAERESPAMRGAPRQAAIPAAEPIEIVPLDLRPEGNEEEVLRKRVMAAAKEHPDEMAQLIRAWMFKRRTATT